MAVGNVVDGLEGKKVPLGSSAGDAEVNGLPPKASGDNDVEGTELALGMPKASGVEIMPGGTDGKELTLGLETSDDGDMEGMQLPVGIVKASGVEPMPGDRVEIEISSNDGDMDGT